MLWSFAGEVHTVTPLSLVICRDSPALRSSLCHGQQSNTSTDTTAKTTFLQVYHVLTVPKHPLTSNPANKRLISKEKARTVLSFGLVEVWVVGTGCSPISSILHYLLRKAGTQLCSQRRFVNLIIFLSICLEMRSGSLKSVELL